MEEQTVNEEFLFEASDFAPAQATEKTNGEDSPAVEETSKQPTTKNEEVSEPADSTEETNTEPQAADEITEFLAKKGVKTDDPDALRKVAVMYRNVEKDYGRKSQEKAQLEREIAKQANPVSTPDKQALNEVRALKTELSVNQWKQSKNLTPEAEQRMMEYCKQPIVDPNTNRPVINPQTGEPFTKGILVVNGTLSLDEVYRLSGGESLKADALRESLKAEITKEMAARQTAKRPTANATDSSQFTKPETRDPFMEGLMGL